MKLEDAFQGMLTDSRKGLLLLAAQMTQKCKAIQKAAEEGDLQALKSKLADGHETVRKLETFFINAEVKATNLTTDEKGGIIDLSVPPERRG